VKSRALISLGLRKQAGLTNMQILQGTAANAAQLFGGETGCISARSTRATSPIS
jgi:hypothetical protein